MIQIHEVFYTGVRFVVSIKVHKWLLRNRNLELIRHAMYAFYGVDVVAETTEDSTIIKLYINPKDDHKMILKFAELLFDMLLRHEAWIEHKLTDKKHQIANWKGGDVE